MNNNETGDWSEWRKLVLHELKRHNKLFEEYNDKFIEMQLNVTRLNVYAFIAGGIGGIIVSIFLSKVL